jgi:hypothetical protein
MRKYLLVTPLLLFLFIHAAAQKSKTGWEYHSLQGRVKSVNEISYEAIKTYDGVKKGGRKRADHIEAGINDFVLFDDKGNELQLILYYNDGSLWKREYYDYDDKGNRIKEIEYDKADTTYPFIHTYKYNDFGNEIERYVFYTSSGPMLDDSWTYNEKNQLVNRINYSTTSKHKLKRYMYTYDKNGFLIGMEEYDWDSVLTQAETYKNDDKGWIIEKKLERKGVEKATYYTYKYDGSGNKIEECHYYPKNVLEYKYTYKYDKENRKIEEIRYRGKNIDFDYRYVYEYDQYGNKVLDDYFMNAGDPPLAHRTWTYKYDVMGNWTESTEYDKDGNPLFIIDREITYY